MTAQIRVNTMIVCPQCGSDKLGKASDRIERYCKSCGSVIEEELIRF